MRKPAWAHPRSASSGQPSPALWVLALLLSAAACRTVDNPRACSQEYKGCPDGQTCDFNSSTCVPVGSIPGPSPEMRRDGGTEGDSEPGVDAPGEEDAPGGEGDGGLDPGETTPSDAGSEVPGSCSVDQHCTVEGLKVCVNGACVGCRTNAQCMPEDRPWCSPSNSCETCQVAINMGAPNVCPPAKPHCGGPSAKCVECLQHGDCKDPGKPACSNNVCVPCNAGGGDGACAARSPDLPKCAAGGTCVQCNASMDCTKPGVPICIDSKCVACSNDAQCAAGWGTNPGLCLVKSGRCATAAEVVYVQRGGSPACGTGSSSGTLEQPACDPQTGLARTSATRNVLLLRGPMPLDGVRISGNGALTLVGQQDAAIYPGVNRGIELTGGRDVYVQGLVVSGSGAEGIFVDGGATLRLNRTIVKGNAKGGLVVQGGAGYEITNSVFDGNGPGIASQVFGGVALESAEGGRPAIFRNNTVVFNKGPGVACETDSQRLTGILFYGNELFDKVICTTAGSLEMVPPGFADAATYRLGAASPCKDKGDATTFPADDIDGEKRPAGARSDCGADEYQGP